MSLDPIVLFCSMIIGSIGFGLFIYGKKQARWPQVVVGLAMLVYPYFIASVGPLVGVAVVLVAGLWWAVRLGW
jgi:hypothetical protein